VNSRIREHTRYQSDAILISEQEVALDALHFRKSAARARIMAQNGDDVRISRMLLQLADEMDAEADLIEAEAQAQAGMPDPTPPFDSPGAAETALPDGRRAS
jgi:hypothetical protein